MGDRVVHAAVRGLVGVARVLPEGGRAVLSDLTGDAARRLLPRRVRIARKNLEQAFPEASPAWIDRTLRDSFRHFAAVFYEVFPLSPPAVRVRAEAMEVEGLDELRRAVTAGRGAFYVTAHLGNWELMAHALAVRGLPLAVLVRRTRNNGLDGMLDRMRTSTGNRVIDKDEAVPRIREVLGQGGIVGILMDQNVLGSKAAFVDFLGGKAATTPVVALLALRHRAPVLAGFTDRTGFGRYRVRMETVWDPEDPAAKPYRGKNGVAELTAAISAVLEREVRKAPGTWLWSHDRFRTRAGRSRRIAVRMPNWVGDAVMAEPFLRGLAASIPDLDLVLLARPPVAGLFAACGYRVHAVVRSSVGERPVPEIDEPFHTVVVLPRSVRAALLARRLAARARVGFGGMLRGALLTHSVAAPERLRGHQVDLYGSLLPAVCTAAGFEPAAIPKAAAPQLALAEPEAVRAGLQARVPEIERPYAVLAPGAAFGSAKRWDAEGFAAVGRELLATREVLVVGSRDEADVAAAVAAGAGEVGSRRARSLAGQTSMAEVAAVLSGASVVVANDSGLMHLAAALGAPVVGIFGATDPAATGPRGARMAIVRGTAPCSPCRYRECPKGRICWGRISPAAVVQATDLLAPRDTGVAVVR